MTSNDTNIFNSPHQVKFGHGTIQNFYEKKWLLQKLDNICLIVKLIASNYGAKAPLSWLLAALSFLHFAF